MRYEVRALAADGSVVVQTMAAPDAADVQRLAAAQGLSVLSVRAARWRLPQRAARFDVVAFSQELVALLSAGLSLPETLDVMIEKNSRAEQRGVVQGLRVQLGDGLSLSQAVARRSDVFSPLYAATVRAAERSGDLCEALTRFIDYEKRLTAVRQKVVSASIYPLALMLIGGEVVLFLLGYVVPRFATIYAESGRDLPWLSQLLIQWGLLLNQHGALVLLAAVALLAGTVWLCKRGSRGATLLAGLPAVRDRVRIYHLARLYRTLAMLQRGGTPLVQALEMVAGLLPPALRSSLVAATARIREGVAVSDSLHAASLTTPVALRMLRVGEKSGELAGMMDRIAAYHDDELSRWVDWFMRVFEPALMALMGVVIGAIVILMYLPIFDLAGSLQ